MKQPFKELMNRYHVNTRPIMLALIGLGFLSVILAATIMASADNLTGKNGSAGVNKITGSATGTQVTAGTILAVVEELDTTNQQIKLFDVENRELLQLSYNGGSNVTDKYGKIISINQINNGIMVDAAYDHTNNKLTSMNISTRAWEYPKVNNLSISQADQIMKIAGTKYKYTDDIFVLDGDEDTTVDSLAEQDVLTVWGFEETIWSIIVTTGHGTVKLEDFEQYLGDTISIGYESMLQITEDFAVTVREGNFNLTVENGLYSATKSVTVLRDQVNYVSLGDLGPVGLRQSDVTFEITPFGADLYIDGVPTAYSDPVELSYGEHSVTATLGGYMTYEGTINIDSEGKIVKIDLPVATSDEEVQVTETDTDSPSDTGSDTDTDIDTDTASDDDDTQTSDGTEYSSEDTDYTLDDGDSLDSDHNIYIKTPSGASVYLDGDYMGTAPCKFEKIIGNHVMTFIREGYETMSYTVDVSDDGLDAYFTFPSLTESE